MGRPTKTEGSPIIYSNGFSLTRDQEDRLLDLLGVDSDEPEVGMDVGIILIDVKTYLGIYQGLIEAMDKAPRPANYLYEIGDPSGEIGDKIGLVYEANNFLQKLCNTSQWIADAYQTAGYDIHEIERELGRFIDLSCKVVETIKLSEIESRGKPEKQALKTIINHLNWVFEKYYSVPDLDEDSLQEGDRTDGRKTTGKDFARSMFIEECLKMGQITYPQSWQHLLWAELDSPDTKKILRQS